MNAARALRQGCVTFALTLLTLSCQQPNNETSAPSDSSSPKPAGSIAASAAPTATPASSGSASSGAGELPERIAAAPALRAEARAQLSFAWLGKELGVLTKAEMLAKLRPEIVTAYDPYYNKPKTFAAVPLKALLALGFAGRNEDLSKQHFVLKAVDGYTVTMEGSRLLQAGGYLALADLDVPKWQPIGPQQADPGPYYLIWSGDDQRQLTTHPRPWQLASIGAAPFEDTFPHTLPAGSADESPPWRGFALFREQCIRCHAINREGGRVGPELNVPQSIVEYRPRDQIRSYIRNPRVFRYGNMPQNLHLTNTQLDDLLAYFDAMRGRKNDPDESKMAH